MSESMRYNLTFGGRNARHLMYTGVMVTPSLQEYAQHLIFEESGLSASREGDKQYRDRDNYHVAIFTGRGSYLVVLSYNLGVEPRPPGADSNHLGYLMLDVKMLGSSLSEALLAAARLIQDLTQSAAFIPLDAEDRERFFSAQANWAAERNVAVCWNLGRVEEGMILTFQSKEGAEGYLASMKAVKPFVDLPEAKLHELVGKRFPVVGLSRNRIEQIRTDLLIEMRASVALAKDEDQRHAVERRFRSALEKLEKPLPDGSKYESLFHGSV